MSQAHARLITWPVLLAGVAIGLCATFPRSLGSAPQGDGHQRMLRLLDEIRARTDVENHYIGDAGRLQAEAQLAALPVGAPDLTRFRLNCLTSIHDMRLGRTEEAIRHLLEAYGLLPKVRAQIPKEIAEESILQLAVAYMRLGENQNCVHGRTSESCILPIRGGGV